MLIIDKAGLCGGQIVPGKEIMIKNVPPVKLEPFRLHVGHPWSGHLLLVVEGFLNFVRLPLDTIPTSRKDQWIISCLIFLDIITPHIVV